MIDDQNDEIVVDELAELKARADQMGLKYHPSIGLEKLREKVNEAITGEGDNDDQDPPAAAPVAQPAETANQRRARLKKEANQLVRVRVTCMNPNKKDWTSEIFTVSNAVVGTLRKSVPFNVEWHVPRFIYNFLKQRQCQVFFNTTDERGNKIRKGKQIKEFAVEVLPNLTADELAELAQRQAMAGGTAALLA